MELHPWHKLNKILIEYSKCSHRNIGEREFAEIKTSPAGKWNRNECIRK
jgi:hypothetical protein